MNPRDAKIRHTGCDPDERGSAILLVLAMLAVFSIMVWHLSAATEGLAREAKTRESRSELKYAAESAAARAFWLLRCDARLAGADAAFAGVDRWKTDGVPRRLEIGDVLADVTAGDANAGIDISGYGRERNLHSYLLAANDKGVDGAVAAERVVDVFRDYVDHGDGDTARLAGMEHPEYGRQGYPELPRNGPLQFREEILWMDGIDKLLPLDGGVLGILDDDLDGHFRIHLSKYERFPGGSRPSLLASSPAVLRALGEFTDLEMEAVLEARRKLRMENIPVAASLDAELLKRVEKRFAVTPSGMVTIHIRVRHADGEAVRDLRITRDTRIEEREAAEGRVQRNWEKLFP